MQLPLAKYYFQRYLNAQGYTKSRHKNKPKQIKFNKEVETFVREKLLENWSPEQISGYAKPHSLFSISHERITNIKNIENAMAALSDKAQSEIVDEKNT